MGNRLIVPGGPVAPAVITKPIRPLSIDLDVDGHDNIIMAFNSDIRFAALDEAAARALGMKLIEMANFVRLPKTVRGG